MTDRASLDARLRAKALACVAQREHSRVELRRKLLVYVDRQQRAAAASASVDGSAAVTAWGSDSDAGGAVTDHAGDEAPPPLAARVDAVLDWLTERDLINADRFVEIRVQARLSRHGALRIRQELSRHGVELDATTDQRLRDTEFARAQTAWGRRFDAPTDATQRARQMRFLLARGFSSDVARQVLRLAGVKDEDGNGNSDGDGNG